MRPYGFDIRSAQLKKRIRSEVHDLAAAYWEQYRLFFTGACFSSEMHMARTIVNKRLFYRERIRFKRVFLFQNASTCGYLNCARLKHSCYRHEKFNATIRNMFGERRRYSILFRH